MASYNPPTENLPIFDSSLFVSSDSALTIDYADKHYLKFPTAQGTENLLAINVGGAATFSSTATFNNNATFKGVVTFQDSSSSINTTMDQTGQYFIIDNNVSNGAIGFQTSNSSGTQTTPLSISSANLTIATTNPPTCTATMPASTDSSTKIPTTAWVQSAIGGAGSAPNPYFKASMSSFSGEYPACVQFNCDNVNSTWGFNDYFTLLIKLTLNYPSSSSPYTSTSTFSGHMDIYPARPWDYINSLTNPVMNINGQINGDDSFSYTDPVYAPYGRPYYSYNYIYTGSNQGIYMYPFGDGSSSGQTSIGFQIINPNGRTSGLPFECTFYFECINSTLPVTDHLTLQNAITTIGTWDTVETSGWTLY